MYADENFATKKAFKAAVASREVRLQSPGEFPPKTDGTEFVEGPWAPQPHTWYAQVTMKDGRVVSVR